MEHQNYLFYHFRQSILLELDQELQAIHKIKWNEILSKLET